MDRQTEIRKDRNGNKVVVIHNIAFKGKRNIQWHNVETYLKRYVGKCYTVADIKEKIYIGADFPDEYANSNYSYYLKGTNAKAKANAVQALPELIQIAANRQYEENYKAKHKKDAQNGWYRYESRFALPVFGENNQIVRYQVFYALMLVRHAKNNKMYLYDMMRIKKEMGNLFQSNDLTQ